MESREFLFSKGDMDQTSNTNAELILGGVVGTALRTECDPLQFRICIVNLVEVKEIENP